MSTDASPGDGDARLLDLLREVGRGEAGAFAELYDATSEVVYGLVLRVVRDHVLAATLTQACYVQFCRQAARFDVRRGSVLSWMSATAHRRAVDHARFVRRLPPPEVAVRSSLAAGDRDGLRPGDRPQRPAPSASWTGSAPPSGWRSAWPTSTGAPSPRWRTGWGFPATS